MEWLLEHIHVYAGTPWWATIALTAVAIRAGMFYGYIGAADNAARMAHIKHLTVPIYAKMKEAQARGDTTAVLAVRQELQIIQRRAGVKLSKTFVPLLQVPIGFGSIVLLRAMSKLPVPGFTEGGLLWFSNLTIADPYFVLPAATAGLLHFMIKVCHPSTFLLSRARHETY
jgi:YidC/Oxa1 family membrane protein insertase